MSCGCGTHLVQELELEQTVHSLTIQQRDAALAEVTQLRAAAAARACLWCDGLGRPTRRTGVAWSVR